MAKACPLFVPLVEENLIQESFAYDIAKYYLQEIIESKVDTLILGCTHYPFLSELICDVLGPKIKIINSSIVTAEQVKKELSKEGLTNKHKNTSKDIFYVSDKPKKFNYLAKTFLKDNSVKVKKIIL